MSAVGKRAVGTTSSLAIPSASKKMVQSIREIVNCSEMEIYSMLKDCDMDPSEAVHRLLSQDTFQEVKSSKREKKKEMKDMPETRSRAAYNSSNRGPRGATERGGRTNSTQHNLNDSEVAHRKLAHKKENGEHTFPRSSMFPYIAGVDLNQKSPIGEFVSMGNTTEATNGVSLPSQPSSGLQSNWARAPGQLSMADVVKMGRPQSKSFSTHTMASEMLYPSHDMTNVSQHSTKSSPALMPSLESNSDVHTSQDPVSWDEATNHDLGTGQHSYNDGWVAADKILAENGSDSIYAVPLTSSASLAVELNSHRGSHMAEDQVVEGNINADNVPSESVMTASSSERLEADNFGKTSDLGDSLLNGINSSLSQMHVSEHHEDEDAEEEMSSATENMKQLDINKRQLGAHSAEDNPAVIIPSHLQVTTDFSHLSFGSFGSGLSAVNSGSNPSMALTSDFEVAPVAEDSTSFDQSHSRTTEYYSNDQLESSLNENMVSRNSPTTRDYDIPPTSQPETIRDNELDAAHGFEANFPSNSGYGYSTTTQTTAAIYTYPGLNSQVPNVSAYSSLMQPFSDPLPNSLAQNAQLPRELDHPLSSLLASQSVPQKYNNTGVSSLGVPSISMPEVQSEVYSNPQSALQDLPSTNVPAGGGPALAQHLPMHAYSQPNLPLAHFANMVGYPFLPQSYAFLPSAAYQQAYAGSSPFHQSLTAAGIKYTLPQYKSSISDASLPQSPALPPGYEDYSTSTKNIPGSYSLNHSTVSNTTPGMDEAMMSSLYKDGSQYLQQSEWMHGAASRGVAALPGSTYYGYQTQQNQHNGGYRQVQQQASPYGLSGYSNYYQNQGGQTQEQHAQNPNEGNLSGSQGTTSHQLWQHGY